MKDLPDAGIKPTEAEVTFFLFLKAIAPEDLHSLGLHPGQAALGIAVAREIDHRQGVVGGIVERLVEIPDDSLKIRVKIIHAVNQAD